jgi:GAF domain-containing protein
LLWLEDARLDPRTCNEPLVLEPPHLRSWIAAPILLEDGALPGVLCVVNTQPQPFDASKAARLQDLADLVADEWARAKAAQAKSEAELALNAAQSQFLGAGRGHADVAGDDRHVAARDRRQPGLAPRPRRGRRRGRRPHRLVELSRSMRPTTTAGTGARRRSREQRSDECVGPRWFEKAWMQAEIMSWRNADGEPGGLVITTNDVTELKAALGAGGTVGGSAEPGARI